MVNRYVLCGEGQCCYDCFYGGRSVGLRELFCPIILANVSLILAG
jgi:hypothetical protein